MIAFLVVLILLTDSLLSLRSKDAVRAGDRRDAVREAFLRLGFTPLYADIMARVLMAIEPPRFARILMLLGEPSKRLRARAMPCLEFTRSVNLEIKYFVL